MIETLLRVDGLTKRFGGLLAVKDLSFGVQRNEVVGLIGPNGAGKTTVFNTVTGMYRPSSGSVFFDGTDITGVKPHELVRRGLTRTFQLTTLFSRMSALENVVTARYYRASGRDYVGSFVGTRRARVRQMELVAYARGVLELVGIAHVADRSADELPHGYQRLLEIAVALATEPRLLMLDEPVTGMSAAEATATVELVRRIRNELDATVLLIEHDMKVVMDVCDRIVVIDFGSKIAEGKPDEISRDESVIAAYLGEELA